MWRGFMAGWAVAMTQPNAERRALGHLERQGYEVYLPRFKESAIVEGRRVARHGVLFSRYLFVSVADRWHSILGTIGVTSLIRNGERPAYVPDEFIAGLRARAGVDGVIDLSKPEHQRKIGDEVSVVAGPVYGFKGIYAGQSSTERVYVLLNLLGRQSKVELDQAQVA